MVDTMNHDIQPLSSDQIAFIRLIQKGKEQNGWTPVSDMLLPLIVKTMPERLIIVKKFEDTSFVKLTVEGDIIASVMPWFGA